jgi:hypothetical protein
MGISLEELNPRYRVKKRAEHVNTAYRRSVETNKLPRIWGVTGRSVQSTRKHREFQTTVSLHVPSYFSGL